MKEKEEQHLSEADAALEREIRAGRKFSLGEAIGRMAGPGAMNGVSPISGMQQATAAMEEFLKAHLSDSGGALQTVLLRRLKSAEQLQTRHHEPLAFLADALRHVLASDNRLKDVVTDADIEWGRIFGERPYFEREGSPPHPDDPYTLESVRASLQKLLAVLQAKAE
ncbi:MAG: hypothetical protein U0796_17135 [Gemmatales bacterium]